jgi:hypothetical protein
MNQSISTHSPTNGKAKALVDADRLCFLSLPSASHSILTFRKTEVSEGNREGSKHQRGKNFSSPLLFVVILFPPRFSI